MDAMSTHYRKLGKEPAFVSLGESLLAVYTANCKFCKKKKKVQVWKVSWTLAISWHCVQCILKKKLDKWKKKEVEGLKKEIHREQQIQKSYLLFSSYQQNVSLELRDKFGKIWNFSLLFTNTLCVQCPNYVFLPNSVFVCCISMYARTCLNKLLQLSHFPREIKRSE